MLKVQSTPNTPHKEGGYSDMSNAHKKGGSI